MSSRDRLKALADVVNADAEDEFTKTKRAMDEQKRLNEEFLRGEGGWSGVPTGRYARIRIRAMPPELVAYFRPDRPLIVGGLLASEESVGFVQARVIRHRWYNRILKSTDPLIVSIGWRRFQTLPIYAIEDMNGRHRMLKYTPEHMHCLAAFFGPLAPPGTGVVAFQSLGGDQRRFRVAATGVLLDVDKSVDVVKKLKLTGVPHKIMRNTAFVRDMFSSELEVARFIGAAIRTVSGIRGQIKKAERDPPGAFRATFEDRIVPSDIVFMRTWYPVEVERFCQPVTSLLQQELEWRGMRTAGEVRREQGLALPSRADSRYREVVRADRVFAPLRVPESLVNKLPFQQRPKRDAGEKRTPEVLERHERRLNKLMRQVGEIDAHVREKKLKRRRQEVERHRREEADHDKARHKQIQEEKRRKFSRAH